MIPCYQTKEVKMNRKLFRIMALLIATWLVLACTCTNISLPSGILGGQSTPASGTRAPVAGKTPTAAPGGKSPAFNIPAGNFVYEVTDAGADNKKIEGGVLQDQSTTSEYVIGFGEKGALARYSVTLFILHDVKPGKITLKPYDKKSAAKGPSAAIFIGAWFYYASGGTLTVDSVADNKITGSFEFKASREDDPSKSVTVKGAFNQIPLVKK
jgi:hypothetical protein